jgi:flavin-dependent dehydrogenase
VDWLDALALEYLDTLGDREPFESHVTEYEKITEGSYAWFNSRIAEIHRKELDEYWYLRERVEELRELDRQ